MFPVFLACIVAGLLVHRHHRAIANFKTAVDNLCGISLLRVEDHARAARFFGILLVLAGFAGIAFAAR